MFRRLMFALPFLVTVPALANDSVAELGTGGLVLSRSDVVAMEKEDLFISRDKITVDYVFRNTSDKDVATIVAFPMPEIAGNPYFMPAIPKREDDNFLGFEVSVDGKPVQPELEHRAMAVGIDISDELKAHGVPFYPFGPETTKALQALPQEVADDWIDRGIIMIEEYDDGSGWKRERSPLWQLRSTYWWRTVFPAGQAVNVSHRYQPSLGGSVGLTFLHGGRLAGATYEDYKRRYCMDAAFEKAVLKAVKAALKDYPALYENRLSYILKTGGNWAMGTIGDFTLTVDKGDAKSLISFCGSKVEKIGPTTFRMKAQDFYPERDLDILILSHPDPEGAEASQDGSGN